MTLATDCQSSFVLSAQHLRKLCWFTADWQRITQVTQWFLKLCSFYLWAAKHDCSIRGESNSFILWFNISNNLSYYSVLPIKSPFDHMNVLVWKSLQRYLNEQSGWILVAPHFSSLKSIKTFLPSSFSAIVGHTDTDEVSILAKHFSSVWGVPACQCFLFVSVSPASLDAREKKKRKKLFHF